MMLDQVIGYLQGKGCKVLNWLEFVAEVDTLMRTALRGEDEHPEVEETVLRNMRIPTGN